MGTNVDGFVHAVTEIARRFDPAFDATTIELEAEQRRQVPRRDDHRQRDQPRAARRAVPDAVDASDGQGRLRTGRERWAQVIIKHLGPVAYDLTLEAMRAFTAARDERTPDEVWLCEHPPVFTQGIAGRAAHVHDVGAVPVVRTATAAGKSRTTGRARSSPTRWSTCAGSALRQGVRVPARAGAPEDARELRRQRPSRARPSRASTSALDAPFGHAVLQPPRSRRRPVRRARPEDRRDRRQGEPPSRLPRRRAQRRDGPAALRTPSTRAVMPG